ncbi:3-dehydroquinate synthase [Buchnera aphidicola (Thelaxes suberi)]|uniref:3-dehydroquinate synthase n=1 Tax=Buchnera aphidicola TaxID=9 RepID=UPI003463F204
MYELNLKLKTHQYPIFIGNSILQKSNILRSVCINKSAIVLVTNHTISTLWKQYIIDAFKVLSIQFYEFVIPDGEEYKNIETIEKCITFLLKKNCNRDIILIAFGGGVIGDITGFVASIYQRGVSYIQIPTTLLAQVDASIGGKTGVNHTLGKNMLGVFWHPDAVIIDTNFLNTLSRKQLVSGMAEVVKYGIIFDELFFNWLEKKYYELLNLKKEDILYCIKKCCEFKVNVVIKDERESYLRTILNLGHTFGHAIESYIGYGKYLHGEAISIGIVMAARTAEILNIINTVDVQRIIYLLKKIGLPTIAPKNMNPDEYIPYMIKDKKSINNGKIRLILPKKIGHVEIYSDIENKIILRAISNAS